MNTFSRLTLLLAGLAPCAQAATFPSASQIDPAQNNAMVRYDAAKNNPAAPGDEVLGSPEWLGLVSAAGAHIGPDKGLSRAIHDTQIYKSASPAVVLILTEDGLGSGSLIDGEGDILTAFHVIAGADKIAVVFKPKQEGAKLNESDSVTAQVVRTNPEKDLAILRVGTVPDGISPIKLAKLEDVMVGADVHAIGHPTGEAWTYTKGIVSQIREDYNWSSGDNIKHHAAVIQTQTPINPGNSGGPLLNDDGGLIGVNSFKTSGAENLNFAVSVDDVQSVLKQQPDPPAAPAPKKAASTCPKPQILYRGPNADNSAEIEVFDSRCTGKANGELIRPHLMTKAATLTYFDGDYFNSTVTYVDAARKGKWEFSVWRKDPKGPWQTVCLHENGDSKPTQCRPYEDVIASK